MNCKVDELYALYHHIDIQQTIDLSGFDLLCIIYRVFDLPAIRFTVSYFTIPNYYLNPLICKLMQIEIKFTVQFDIQCIFPFPLRCTVNRGPTL